MRFSLPTLLLLATAQAYTDTTTLLVEVSRHGSRASHYIYPLTTTEEGNFQVAYELTQQGAYDHQWMGQFVRQTYMEDKGFLPETYSSEDVWVFTTAEQRTIDSANAQLDGLYNRTLTYPQLDMLFTLNTCDPDDCLITHATESTCSYLGDVVETSEYAYGFAKVYADLNLMYSQDFYPRLRELTDMEDADDDTMADVTSYLYWAQKSHLDLSIELDDDDQKYIEAQAHQKLWFKFMQFDQLYTIPSFEFFNQMSEFAQIQQGANWYDMSYFTHYFKGDSMPKFVFYSAHAETVYPILAGLGMLRMESVEPGAALFVEYFTREYELGEQNDDTSLQYVKMYYKSQSTQRNVYLPGRTIPEVPVAEFETFINGQIRKWNLSMPEAKPDLQVQCDETFDGTGMDFFGSDSWYLRWRNLFQLGWPYTHQSSIE